MKAIQITKPRHLEELDISEPQSPGPAMVLVESKRMGVCGTDYCSYLGKFPFFEYPRIPGHELGVEVLEVGDGVSNVRLGDKCSVEPYLNCGNCYACRHGTTNCCQSLSVIGVMTDGGLREKFLIRADKLHPSTDLNFEQLALVETLAIGCHACDRGAPTSNEQVLIIGAGPIGLASIEFVRLAGAEITVMDKLESRLEFCQTNYGIRNTIHATANGDSIEKADELTSGDKYAVVIDATGNSGSMANALNFLAPNGRLVFVGVTSSEIAFKHAEMHKPEATILASRNALPKDFSKIIGLIENGSINTAPWITHRVSFDKVPSEFGFLTKPDSRVIKAMIEIDV